MQSNKMFFFHFNQGCSVSVSCFLHMPLFCLTHSYPLTLARWSIHSLPQTFHRQTLFTATLWNACLRLHKWSASTPSLSALLLTVTLSTLLTFHLSILLSRASRPDLFWTTQADTQPKIRQPTRWIETSVAIYKGSTSRELFPFLIRCFANWLFLITAKRNLMLKWSVGQVWNHPEWEGRQVVCLQVLQMESLA